MIIKMKLTHKDALEPKYQTEGASGFDFHALEDTVIYPGQTVLVDTGVAFELPEGYELQVRPRSGLSFKTPLRISNAPGTVDQDFLDSVKVIMENKSDNEKYNIKKHDRIAQGVIAPVVRGYFVQVDELTSTKRGTNGLGSTGI